MLRLAPAAVLLVALSAPALARATVMLEASIDDLARESDTVVLGKVRSTEGRLSGDGKRIFTYVTVEVAEAWKGEPGKTVEVRVPGGVHGEFGQIVQGAPRFTGGEEVVIFLRRVSAGSQLFQVSGLAQGKLRVEREPDREPVAMPDLRGLELTRSAEEPAFPAKPVAPIPVAELRSRVEAVKR